MEPNDTCHFPRKSKMAVPLHTIIQRLRQENLHGPMTSPLQGGGGTNPNTSAKKGGGGGLDAGRFAATTGENVDLDFRDPRWFELFIEFFIDVKGEVSDDILFFVRQFVPSNKSSTGSINDVDPVFVKRRVAGQIPQLNDVIDWKQSFFLNLICQLPCTLTVAVCNKSVADSQSSSSERDGVADLQGQTKGSNNASTDKSKEKSGMVARKRITNKVYASPYKSRMDVKDAMMNECSFPLVFYTINDYEDENLHLTVTSGEYLCAELSVTVPKVPSRDGYTRATELVAQVPLDQDNDPFPLPPSHEKIILFQGAVAFKALSDVYQQKGVAAITQMRGGWGRKDIAVSTASARTEFVLMRGPHGKGQCQGMYSKINPPQLTHPLLLRSIYTTTECASSLITTKHSSWLFKGYNQVPTRQP